MFQRIQRRTYEIVDGEVPDKYSQALEVFIALLVIANVIGIILESVPEIHDQYASQFHYFDMFSVIVFSIEYLVRVWSYGAKYCENGAPMTFEKSCSGRKAYIFSFYGIIDFLSTVPFYLQLLFPGADLRVLRMFRLLRIFKLSRYNSAFDDMVAAVKAERDSFSSAVFLMFIACLLFSSLIYIIEGTDQPEVFPSIPAAMHWFMITIISGWGNVDPVTFVGSILVICTQILSIALAAILTGVVATAYTAQVERREALYEMELREILADGIVTPEEQKKLKLMQAKFGMSDDQVESLIVQMEEEKRLSGNHQNS
ncbi:MAG TPA: ion transporter [Limnohabitans sp.]|jgi:voltage-gated potassium channel|nr:ion transporter [Limnohabitans sp.]HQS25781.1 ion transporter [Limnohabitans sp.]